MSDLTAFRDHCRKMAGVAHKPECRGHAYAERLAPPACPGCNPAADRALFALLADEVDDYLARPVADVDLFGELSEMPTIVEETA